MRLTFPRSQGKQVYYDARKSAWGDIFPHTSKNKEVERYRPPVESSVIKRNDVGKRGAKKVKHSYEQLEREIKNRKDEKREWRRRERGHSSDLD